MTHAMSHSPRPTGHVPFMCTVPSTLGAKRAHDWLVKQCPNAACISAHTPLPLSRIETMIVDRHRRERRPSHTMAAKCAQRTIVSIQADGLWWNHTSLRQGPVELCAVNPATASRPYTFK